jgi:hypothetical protein
MQMTKKTHLTTEERDALEAMVLKNDVGRLREMLAVMGGAVLDKFTFGKGADPSLTLQRASIELKEHGL